MHRYKLHIVLLVCFFSLSILGQTEEKLLLNKGVKSYNNGDYASAQSSFEEAYAKNSNYNLALYNAANSAYRSGDFEKALEYYNQYAGTLYEKNDKAKAYHNVGNAYLKQNKLKESIEAYKNALRNNPNDEDTRYNLSYALSKLKRQEQQQNKDQENKDNKDNKDQNDQDKDKQNKDQNKDQESDQNKDGQKDQDQQDKNENKDQNKDDQGDEDKQKEKDKEGEDKPKPGDQKEGEKEKEVEGQMTKGQIEKDLDAINNDEKNILLKIARQKGKENKTSSSKDW